MPYNPDLAMAYEPDPYGEILGTGMQRFETKDGVGGLCKFDDKTFELLAVHVHINDMEQGKFRRFIAQLKTRFRVIKIWHVDNPWLPAKLIQYGFRPWSENECIQGHWEVNEGFRWDK